MSESETISDSETISESETISDHESVIFEQDIDDNDDDEHIAFFTKNLSVSEVIHSAFPVEYPKTSPQGVATIFNVSGWTNPMVCFSDIQYSINGSGGSNSIQNCPFFGVPVKKDERKCQGIKHCSFASPDFINSQHCEVDVESETYIKLNQNYNKNNLKTKTYVFFLAAQSSVCKYKDRNQRCNGQAKLRKIIKNSGEVEYIIGCDKWIKGKKWHRYIKVPEEIDLRLLQDLFRGHDISENNEDNVDNDCYTLIPRASKTKFCEFPHVQNGQVVRGTIVEQKCDVRFIKFIPYDLVACPYIALVCIGVHNHPPPPPDRTPVGIKDELQVMIQNSISLNDGTTPHSIITDNSIRATFDKETLSEVYASLNNVDKLRSLVAKGYKDLYPYGQDNLGVLYSVQCKKFDMHNYVRRIEHFEDGQILILCMLDFQAKALQQLKCFQMDLAYKRVYGNINEFEINAYDGVRKSVLSYCRIYTNIFTADAYQRLFTQLFEVVENLSGTPVKFRHIDGSGWECILGDLDQGQAKGLGMALEKRDPSKDWELHLTYIFKSCLIHFNRDLAAKRFDNEVYSLAASIPFQSSVEEVYGCFKQLESYNEPCITDWVQYHRQPYILASLNKHVSNMDNEVWECYGSNINATEAAHAQANREGKQLKLLTAIMRGKRLDEKLFKKIEAHNKFGVPRARRDKSEIKRKSIEMTRKDTHKRNQKETSITFKQEALPYDDITDHGGSGKRRNKRKTITNESTSSTSNVKKNRVNEIGNEQENDLFEVNNSLKNIEIEERRLH